jgi:hypothetical protein
MPPGIPGSGPTAFGKRSLKQIIARIDRKKVDEMYRMLREEGMNLQVFIRLCVDAYISSDSRMRGLIEAHRREQDVSEQEKSRGLVFSDKERAEILREIKEGE